MTLKILLTSTLVAATAMGSHALATADDDHGHDHDRREHAERGHADGERNRAEHRRGEAREHAADDRARNAEPSMEARIAQAVGRVASGLEDGSLTKEQAIEHLRGLQRRLQEQVRRAAEDQQFERQMRERYRAAEAEMHAAVERGDMTQEQAEQRLRRIGERMRKAMQQRHDDHGHDHDGDGHHSHGESQGQERRDGDWNARGERQGSNTEIEWEAINQRLDAAVESGQISAEEAERIREGLRERMRRVRRDG